MQNTQVPKQRDPKANFGCSHAAHKDSEITNQALAGRRVRYLALETFDYLYAHPRHVQCLWDLVGRNWVVVVCVPARAPTCKGYRPGFTPWHASYVGLSRDRPDG